MQAPSRKLRQAAYATIFVSALSKNGTGSPLRQWSSLIGIVTAIIGNILISFALNIQRYAHIRINRESYARRPQSKKQGLGSPKGVRNYGTTTQEDIAEERARLNAEAPGPGGKSNGQNSDRRDDEEDERQPLKTSFDSDDTLADDEKDGDAEEDDRKSYLKSPYWWIGITLMTVGEAGNFLAYGFAPASIVSPLGVVALVSNCVIAPFMLKERFRQRDAWGVLVAIAGAVTVVLSAKQSETKMGPDDLWDAIKRWEFLTYIGITVLVMIALLIASPRYGSRTVLIDLGLVGLFGGYTALSTKGVASLLSDTLWRALTFPITYFLILILVLSALMQIRYVNKALQNFDSTQVIPTQFVMFTLSVIIGSAVLYRDFESATADRVGKFVGGCFLTFFGVYLITSARPQVERANEDDYSDDEEEAIHLIDDEAKYSLQKQKTSEIVALRPEDRPVTPEEDGITTPRRVSLQSSVPAVAVTTPEAVPTSSMPSGLDQNPWTLSTPSTPQSRGMNRSQSVFQSSGTSTPFYTPQTSRAPPFKRGISTPAAPETPTKSKRTASPPKPDLSLRPPPTPHSTLAHSARGSISRLLPGPYMAPLSSSLSAVVAESLRREGSPRQLRRNRSSRHRDVRRQSVEETPLSRQQTRETEPDDTTTSVVDRGGEQQGRLRSISGTLGRMMSSKGKERDKGGDSDGPR